MWTLVRISLGLTAVFFLSAEISSGQNATDKSEATDGYDQNSDSLTLLKLKQDVVQLSYKSRGRRVIKLRSEQQKNSTERLATDKPQIPHKKTNDIGSQFSFELSCNPLGELETIAPLSTSNQGKSDTIEDEKLKHIGEMACLEPEFDDPH